MKNPILSLVVAGLMASTGGVVFAHPSGQSGGSGHHGSYLVAA